MSPIFHIGIFSGVVARFAIGIMATLYGQLTILMAMSLLI